MRLAADVLAIVRQETREALHEQPTADSVWSDFLRVADAVRAPEDAASFGSLCARMSSFLDGMFRQTTQPEPQPAEPAPPNEPVQSGSEVA